MISGVVFVIGVLYGASVGLRLSLSLSILVSDIFSQLRFLRFLGHHIGFATATAAAVTVLCVVTVICFGCRLLQHRYAVYTGQLHRNPTA